jgi:tetratricopeptide (TPR) repeat protein
MIDALFDLLGTFYQSGNFEQAEWIARSILQAIPDDIVSLQFLGLLYYRTRRRAQAVQVFAAAAGEAPASAVPPALATAACKLRHSAGARRAPAARHWPAPGMTSGRLLLRLGHRQQAVDALQAAIAAQPDLHKARRAMAQITRNSGRQEAQAPEVGTDGS